MTGLAAGDLNRLILIEARDLTVDDLNQQVDGWVPWTTKWANIKAPSGMSQIKGSQQGLVVAVNSYSFRIRYTPDILNTAMRINLDGQLFDIQSVTHDLANREYTDIVCQLGANNG